MSIQEIKIEFLLSENPLELFKFTAPQLFAVKTDRTYQILPLDCLLADKLTTLGPNTIGIQSYRMDEQIKQLYDIEALITWNIDKLNFTLVRKFYLSRAKLEVRARGIKFDVALIYNDVIKQLEELSLIDFPTNIRYKKRIDDFQSLYLRRSVNRNIAGWAIVGKKLLIMFQLLKDNDIKINEKLRILYNLEKRLDLNIISGPDKGRIIKKFKRSLLEEFESHCRVPVNQIKGKHQKRVFWEILSINNMVDVVEWTEDFFRTLDS